MKFYFSVISHQHDELILKLKTLQRLSKYHNIIVIFRDNVASESIKNYCRGLGIDYACNHRQKGFAENNNLNFLRAKELGMKGSDYFILLNPDVLISYAEIDLLIKNMIESQAKLAAPNLFLNKNKKLFDDNLRSYPKFLNFIKNYLAGNRSTVINKNEPDKITTDFWASGAFLLVKANVYEQLNGFDERYYLYCEDIDFCYRALQLGIKVSFLAENTAVHYRQCASRKFLSREFFFHVISVFKYVQMIHGYAHTRSQLKLNRITAVKVKDKPIDATHNA